MRFFLILYGLCFWGALSAQTPKVGDVIVNDDGSVGVVFWIQPDGSRGWMVALKDSPKTYPWGPNGVDIPGLDNIAATPSLNQYSRVWEALKDTAGYQHTLALRAKLGAGNKYAAQVVDFANGWCLPSVGQFRTLFGAWAIIFNTVIAAGGEDLQKGIYWSSSEYDKDQAWRVSCNSGEPMLNNKKTNRYVRPVRPFRIQALEYDQSLTYRWNTGEVVPEVTSSPQADTEYRVWVENVAGCTASASQRIFVSGSDNKIIYASICRGEVYAENGFYVSEAGTWPKTFTGPGGCEVTVTLILDVNEPVETVLNETICEGDIYSANNFTAWEEGDYRQAWTSAQGCDSVVILHLKVNPAYEEVYDDTICSGATYEKYGFLLPEVSESGAYTHNFSTQAGCDSVIILNLEVLPAFSTFFSDAVCSGDSYDDHGFALSSLTRDTICRDTFLNRYGCDSIVVLSLTVHPSFYLDYTASVCAGQNYEGHGFMLKEVTEDSLCRAEFHTQYGCDSIVQLYLSVMPLYLKDDEQEICSNETYHFRGRDLRDEGVYYDSLTTIAGCDSIFRLSLRVNPAFVWSSQVMTCANNVPYDFRGRQLDESGIYYDSLRTVKGCDSVFVLNLQVNACFNRIIDTAICRGSQFIGEGFQESKAGHYEQHFVSEWGCDSIIHLNLEVEDPFEGELVINNEDCRLHQYFFAADSRDPGNITTYQFNWIFGDGTTIEEKEPLHEYSDSGRYKVAVSITTPGGCRTDLWQDLYIPYYQDKIESSFKCVPTRQNISTVYFQAEEIAGMKYTWDFGDGESAVGPHVSHNYEIEQQESFEVTLTVSNADQCEVEQIMLITVFPGIGDVPNTITPNGDGVNDVFMKGYAVRIIDRNGVEIFRGDDGWDGTRNGQKVTDDTYFYELYYMTEKGRKTLAGYVMVVEN